MLQDRSEYDNGILPARFTGGLPARCATATRSEDRHKCATVLCISWEHSQHRSRPRTATSRLRAAAIYTVKHDNSEMKLRSDNPACAQVLGTMRRLPERRRVLGEARSSGSSVGAGEDDGGDTALRDDGALSKMEQNECSGYLKDHISMLCEH